MNHRTLHRVSLALLLTLPLGAQAMSIVTSRADLGADDRVNWEAAGHIFTIPTASDPNSYLANSFAIDSADGLHVNVQIPVTTVSGVSAPLVFQTKSGPMQIPTNFARGDYILLAGLDATLHPAPGNPGPITITFATPVRAAGAQVAVDDAATSFTLHLSAFDALNQLLGEFEVSGTSSTTLDNSAAFLGVRGDTANIKTLVYSSDIGNRALGMNQLDILSAVPEPGGLFATGLLILVARRTRRAVRSSAA